MQVSDQRIVEMFPEEHGDIEEQMRKGLMEIPQEEFSKVSAMSRPMRKNWMRNKPCLCKSGKKFKHCCWSKYA